MARPRLRDFGKEFDADLRSSSDDAWNLTTTGLT
jgi:hypothetical protein